MDFLLEAHVVEPNDLRQPNSGAIAIRAILHRAPQPSVTLDDGTGRPGGRLVDQNGIARVGLPGPVQIAGVRTGRGRTWAAFMHALHRDALPT